MPRSRGSAFAVPDGFALAGLAAAAIAVAPIIALAVIAARGSGDLWRHLFTTVVPAATVETALLAIGVAVFVMVVGTATAWLVAAHDFPGRRLLEVALLLPLAFPAYVLAYSWLDLLHPIGPIQSAIRAVLGYARPADFRLPDPRSLPGAVLVFGLALYPYVYVAVRTVFLSQMTRLTEAARMLGADGRSVFFRVALPLSRPAIAAGASLAVMETLNDVGAAEFLSINTLTAAVYSTWVNRSDLAGASQIALAMLVFVLSLLVIEKLARGNRGYAVIGRSMRPLAPRRVDGLAGIGLFALGFLPAFLGFVVPAAHLVKQASSRLAFAGLPQEIVVEIGNTLLVAALATVVAVGVGLVVVAGRRLHPGSRLHAGALRVSTLGYAVPGTVLAIGLLVIFGGLDGLIREAATRLGLKPTGLVFSASITAIVVAYVVRFFRLSASKIETGLERIAPSLDQSARTLGRTPLGVLREIHLPLMTPTLAGAALLVFVDCMKELPATLLLRPLNFETLSTHLYGEAARGTYENGALAALLIVAFGLLPIIVLTGLGRRAPVRTVPEGEPA